MADDRAAAEYLKQVALVPASDRTLVPRAARAGAPSYLVELAKEVAVANTTIKAGACGKLEIIAQQIRFLQEQARQVLLDASTDELITQASCNFIKKPGKTYHLYKRDDGTPYLGMISPEEWGGDPPHEFIGSYKLEFDMTFTPLEMVEQRDQAIARVEDLFNERHIVPHHPPNIDISRHTLRRGGDRCTWINRPPSIEQSRHNSANCPGTSEGTSNGI